MTAWTDISSGLVAVGAKPFATTVQALRDNPVALGEKDATVPLNLRLGKWPLGTIATTSGASFSLGSLDLTYWTTIECIINGVSPNGSNANITLNAREISADSGGGSDVWNGKVEIDLASGVATSIIAIGPSGTSPLATSIPSGLSNASTSITFGMAGGTGDAGQILVYGVR